MGENHARFDISDDEFLLFQEYFYGRTGIAFSRSKRYFVDKRVADRIAATGSASFCDYFSRLQADRSGREFQALVNLLTVNETYFYREEYQFKCLVDDILDEIVACKQIGNVLRVWSVPCSTGEEPYSLALYMLENWPRVDDYNIEIVASDIDTHALAMAKAGIYNARSLQYVPKETVRRYFTEIGNNRFEIIPAIREAIEFTTVNVNDRSQTRSYRSFDVIFCRNLLIYFDDVSRRQAAEAFYDALNPGGFICLGHSESMSRMSALFTVRKFPQAIVYQKPLQERGS